MLQLLAFATALGCTVMRAEAWHEPFECAMQRYGIDSPIRQAAFLAQVGHESSSLSRLEEDLRYGAQRLLEVWPHRFPGGVREAMRYEYAPELIANRVYGGRMGNGPEASGDGWTYRGRGPLQITGRENYTRAGAALDKPLMEYPDLVAQDTGIGAMVAGWVWDDAQCNACAADVSAVTRRINGGLNGVTDRMARFERALKAIA